MPGTEFSPLRMMAWAMIALGAVLLLSLFWRGARGLWRRFLPMNVWVRYAQESSPYRRRKSWGFMGVLLVLLLGTLFAGSGWGLLHLEGALQAYESFPLDDRAARLQCWPGEVSADVVMTCTLSLDSPVYSDTVTLEGMRWGLYAEAVVWDPALERLGLHSGYRLVRLEAYDSRGRFTEGVSLPSAPGGLTKFSRLDRYLPFVEFRQEVISGEAVSGQFYELIVSRQGFSLREWGPQP